MTPFNSRSLCWLMFLFVMIVAVNFVKTNKTLHRNGRGANLNVNFDTNDFMRQIESWIRHSNPGERKGFVKGLAEMANFKAPRDYSVMVYNMNQEYANGLRDVIFHNQVHEYNSHFGIWVFKCGTFMNKGDRGWENWAAHGDIVKFHGGSGYIFKSPTCDHPAYRPFNHYVLHNKDYPQPNIREFFDVESVEECMAWTIEIDQNVAVYEPSKRICHVKPSNYGGGITYERNGAKIGTYDVKFQDVEDTRDNNKRREWINSGKCDAMHTLTDGRHFCKVFVHDPKFTLIIRRRD